MNRNSVGILIATGLLLSLAFFAGTQAGPFLKSPAPEELEARENAARVHDARKAVRDMIYVREERTGLCFATGLQQEGSEVAGFKGRTSTKYIEVMTVYTTVPCGAVTAYLVQ